MRMEFCRFHRPYDGHIIMAAFEAQLDGFYNAMEGLDKDLADAGSDAGGAIRHAQVTEIARLHKWLESVHMFSDGNTRLNGLVVSKLLVEFGFTPSIIAQRCDSPFFTPASWATFIEEGMERWNALCLLNGMGLIDLVWGFRTVTRRP